MTGRDLEGEGSIFKNNEMYDIHRGRGKQDTKNDQRMREERLVKEQGANRKTNFEGWATTED